MKEIKCYKKRNIFELTSIFKCGACPYKAKDEEIYLGGKPFYLYFLFDRCPSLLVDREELLNSSLKLKVLLKDAVKYQEDIFFIFEDDLKIEEYLNIIEAISDTGLSVQIVII